MEFSVSIVVHNSRFADVQVAVLLLLQSEASTIYIIENSPLPRFKALAAMDPRIFYAHVENNGFGAAHNIALRKALQDPEGFHLIMNPDVFWSGSVPEILTGYLASNPDVGMVAPRVYYPDGDLQYTCRMLPTPFDLILKRFLPKRFFKKRRERYLLAHHDHTHPINCPYLQGSFLLFRNKALLDCGIFDEQFFMYPEDIDITRRIHERWKTIYFPSVSIVHFHQAASRTDYHMLQIHLTNMIKYFNKWGWWFDKKRRLYNKRLLEEVVYQAPEDRPDGRG
jgi:GT2 family glycosyltransferase